MARLRVKPLWGFVRLFKLASLIFVCAAAGCSGPPAPTLVAETSSSRPKRIVSLDYCADQFVLKLADRADILALSPDATRDFSYMRREAVGLKTVRPTGEDVLALEPDLIVRSYGGGANAKAFFERAGVKVHQIGWGDDFASVRANTLEASAALGQMARGEATIRDFDQRLAKIAPAKDISALYITRGGVTTGPGTMIDEMFHHAGLTNFQTQNGWNQLPLEQLVSRRPDMAVTAFFGKDIGAQYQDYWSASRHGVARAMLRDVPVAQLDNSVTSCAAWFVMDGVEALSKQGRDAQAVHQAGGSHDR
jgi:iron complex transport system substrate-binding protein